MGEFRFLYIVGGSMRHEWLMEITLNQDTVYVFFG